MTHCTHGYPAMHHLKVGDTCAICNTIVTVVASPATTGHRGGEGIGDALTSEIRTALPAATSLPARPPQTAQAAAAGGVDLLTASPAAPVARSTDPATSWAAATNAKSTASQNRIRCLFAHVAAGERGLTGDELEQVTGIAYEVIGPRRPWLVENGFLTEPIGKRQNNNGQAVNVHAVTPEGREMAARLVAEGYGPDGLLCAIAESTLTAAGESEVLAGAS